jgi:predicted transglutaminase-like cysteine proteinase
MQPVWDRGKACALPAGAFATRQAWRRLRMLVLALSLLLAPAGISEGSAMSARLGPFSSPGAYSTDLTGFPKWRGMLERFSLELSDPTAADARIWGAFAANLRAADRLKQLRTVNAAINTFPYVSDDANWGTVDFWETPIEFMHRAGDCEDFAVTKYMALRALGVAIDDMRIAVVDDRQISVTHAVLLVAADDRDYVLDNLTDEVVSLAAMPFYRPIYAINEHGWWNYGPPSVVRAAGP